MDETETLAAEHLAWRGFVDVVFEPDGNVPPDFLVDGRVAVEVRRLNQHEKTSSGPRGLEDDAIKLKELMTNLLPTLGRFEPGESWWVMARFKRPILPWNAPSDAGALHTHSGARV